MLIPDMPDDPLLPRPPTGPYAASGPRFGTRPLVEACSWCRRVRGLDGQWSGSDSQVTGADVTHGICPDCVRERCPELEGIE